MTEQTNRVDERKPNRKFYIGTTSERVREQSEEGYFNPQPDEITYCYDNPDDALEHATEKEQGVLSSTEKTDQLIVLETRTLNPDYVMFNKLLGLRPILVEKVLTPKVNGDSFKEIGLEEFLSQ